MSTLTEIMARVDAASANGPYGAVKDALTGLSVAELRALIGGFAARPLRRTLPASIRDKTARNVTRIIGDLQTRPDDFYCSSNDLFIKDLCIVSGRLIPAGAQLVHETGVPRRVVAAHPLAARLLWRGVAPFYEIHTHDLTLEEFNAVGWAECYRRIVEMMALAPAVRGVFGSSWFFDDRLKIVSPRLAYLRELPRSGGAAFFKVGSAPQSIALATSKSETRRKLYAEGKYLPTSYLMIWLRKDLIRWAEAPAV